MSFYNLRIEDMSASVDNQQQRSYDVTFIVDSTDIVGPKTARETVLTALGGIGAHYLINNVDGVYEEDLNSYLQSVEVSHDDQMSWKATATWTPNAATASDNPFTEAPEVSWEGVNELVPVDRDIFGNAIVNAAGDTFLQATSREEIRNRLLVSRYEPTFDPVISIYASNLVNNATFNLMPSGTVKSGPISCTIASTVSGMIPRVTYSFDYNPNGWEAVLLNQGKRELSASGVLREIILNGQPVSEPIMLDANGKAMLTPSGSVTYVSYQIYHDGDYDFYNLNGLIT